MKLHTALATLALILATGTAMAEEKAKDPDVLARQGLMNKIAKSTKVLGDMASGKTEFSGPAATNAKKSLIDYAPKIPAAFEKQADDPKSEAKPNIWTDMDGFNAKAKGLGDAAGAIDVSSLETLKAGMGEIGGACKACHKEYRAKK